MKTIDETPNFLIVVPPEEFALMTALFRTSIGGREYMFKAILSDEAKINIPAKFTSRAAEILEAYYKSLGVSMKTILDEEEFIGEKEHDMETLIYELRNKIIVCTPNEMYYLNKLGKLYKHYIKDNPNAIYDVNEVWDYVVNNISFKKKHLTDYIINTFKCNLEAFTH
jgi:hypothetical protein